MARGPFGMAPCAHIPIAVKAVAVPDELETLGSLIAEVKTAQGQSGWTPALIATDAEGQLRLAESWTTDPKWRVPYRLPDEAALEALYDFYFPPTAGAPVSVAAAVGDLKAAVDGVGNLPAAVDSLAKADWSVIHEVLRQLAEVGPTLGGRLYLDLLNDQIKTLPDVDPRAAAAVLAGEIHRTRATPALTPLDAWSRFVDLLLTLHFRDQVEVFAMMGIEPEDAEGALALFASEAAEAGLFPPAAPDPAPLPLLPGLAPALAAGGHALAAGGLAPWLAKLGQLWKGINPNGTTFEDWKLKDNRLWGRYIGTSVHLSIGAFYRAAHASHLTGIRSPGGTSLWTNSTPVLTILNAMQTAFSFTGGRLRKAFAISRPDIFEFGFTHGMPPGYVYEIKPYADGAGLARALAEAGFYTGVLTACDIPAMLGPVVNPGVDGVVPVVGGWAAFVCPVPGVIVYRYKRATDQRLKERATATAPVPRYLDVRVRTEDLVRASGTAAQIVQAGLLAAIFALLLDYGWVLLFL
jgi:hypothetical protein